MKISPIMYYRKTSKNLKEIMKENEFLVICPQLQFAGSLICTFAMFYLDLYNINIEIIFFFFEDKSLYIRFQYNSRHILNTDHISITFAI